MDNLFCTELSTSREREQQTGPKQQVVIPPLPLIEKKLSNFAPPPKRETKVRHPKIKNPIRNKKKELDPETKFIIAHPTKLPTTLNQIQVVEKQLKQLFEEYTSGEDYDNAAHIQRILNSLQQKKRLLMDRDECDLPCIQDENKKQELMLLVDNYINKWNKSLEQFMETTDQQARILFDNQQREMDEFDENIPQKLTVQFKKPSSQLLDMRRTEKRCAQQQRYNQAIKLKNQADVLEIKESQAQLRKMKAHYMNKRQTLSQKHDDQLKVFFEHAEQTRATMIAQRDKMIDGYMNRVKRIDENIENYCQQADISKEDIPEQLITKERMKKVKRAEKLPIPTCRPRTSFTKARQKLLL